MRTILWTFFTAFIVTAIITHVWTTIIGFQEGGFFGGILTFIFPFLSEVYWMIKMFGENNLYSIIALIHLILALLYAFTDRN